MLSLLLWDVDHTLIENGGVSKENYALAFELLFGRTPKVQPRTDGCTDIGIMESLLSANGVDASGVPVERQLDYLGRAALANYAELVARGYALPGAEGCLSLVAQRPDVIQSLLTGNIQENARGKLGAFRLSDWFDWECAAFGADSAVRAELVPVAQRRASVARGFDPSVGTTVLVGDTELDVSAGLAGGARVIGVATGINSVEELREAGADAVLPDLTDADRFLTELDRLLALGPVGPGRQRGAGQG